MSKDSTIDKGISKAIERRVWNTEDREELDLLIRVVIHLTLKSEEN